MMRGVERERKKAFRFELAHKKVKKVPIVSLMAFSTSSGCIMPADNLEVMNNSSRVTTFPD